MNFALALGLLLLGGQASDVPKFEDYAVSSVFHGTPARPILRTRGERLFRTMIRQAAAKGSNFAGHYAIAEWGCGAGCASLAVIDLTSGAVYEGPFGQLPEAHVSFPATPESGFSYRPTSRLVIVNGCPNESNCGVYYYEWTGKSFREISHRAH